MQSELLILIPFVLLISFSYSLVGLGGGSSYTALLTIVGISHVFIPSISLSLNVLVTVSAVAQFARKGHLKLKVLLPFLVTSVPAAYAGGSLELAEGLFRGILLITLIGVAARIYLWKDPVLQLPETQAFRTGLSLVIGALLGFVAGAVGIGGGIYLVPIIIVTGIASTKEAAATGAAFILINSIAGLAARSSWSELPWDLIFPLGATVLVGGLVGSYVGSEKWTSKTVRKVLGVIILAAIVLLVHKMVA